VLVSGAVPGERVRARVERTNRHVIWAATVEVLEASPHRRAPWVDGACGGLVYAHIAYEQQTVLKGAVLVDAFRRVGKMALDTEPRMTASPEHGYRMRARLHVRGGQAGFFREGTHTLCDAGATAQLLPEALAAVSELVGHLGARAEACEAITVAENVSATERVLHLEARVDARLEGVDARVLPPTATGLSVHDGRRAALIAGSDSVTDTAVSLLGPDTPVPSEAAWTRRATSFFQGNRYLTGALVRRVLAQGGGRVADFYAGVGLFAVAFAAAGAHVVAVEGDRGSASDLERNAAPWAPRLRVVRGDVAMEAPQLSRGAFDTVVLDPPRTGVTPPALSAVAALDAPCVVYVSCDPATLARDAAKLTASGYRLSAIDAFDLFPNTAHIETVAVFDRR
jgi:23S rRNA (uracil1939-C5)-methyltransferase